MEKPICLYDKIYEELVAEGKVYTFTEDEHAKLAEELSSGMNDFLQEERLRQAQSALEIRNVFLK